MAELFISKRAFFPKGKQQEFINRITTNLSIQEIAKICDLSERTIRDWRREKFSMDSSIIHKLCKKTGTPFPKNIKLKDRYWYTANGSSAGGIAVFKKYGRVGGDPEYRKKKWYEWWKKKGKYNSFIATPKPFRKPGFSKELAEFIGIVLGDGSITRRQITITLHHKDDKQYGKFVVALIKKLFNVHVGLYYRRKDSVINFIISRSELVRFCVEKLGLKQGNKVKQQVDIPNWIKQNKPYLIACVRGLVDTDGCIFAHKYRSNGKWYTYRKLAFSNRSEPLIKSVFNAFYKLNMNPRITKDGKDVRLESKRDLRLYFLTINSHNPKNLKKYKN